MPTPSQPDREHNKRKPSIIAAVAVAIFLALIVGVVVITTRMTRSPDGRIVKVEDPAARSALPAASGEPATRPSSTPKIKVGVYLSHFTANGPNWTGKG